MSARDTEQQPEALQSPPAALRTERLEEGERLLFAAAETQRAWIAGHLARRYQLGPGDTVDSETGEIHRVPRPTEAPSANGAGG